MSEGKDMKVVLYEDGTFNSWFDANKATVWEGEQFHDGHNLVEYSTRSQWRHARLYRSTTGNWYLETWNDWQKSAEPSIAQVNESEAAAWLIKAYNGKIPDDDRSKHLPEFPDEE